nr:phospholipase-like protein [Tanacetum cinerariifolium]
MNPERYKKFRRIVFGLWLDIRTQEHDNHLINYLLQHQRYVKDPSTDTPFIFDIGQHTLEFGRREFCLVIGFRFEKFCLNDLSKGRSGFRDRVFPRVARVKGIELNKLLYSQTDFNNPLDDDVVRVCLLLALDFVFMGFELIHVISNEVLNLVDDFSAWDNFPWGHYIWEEFHKRVHNNDHTVRKKAWFKHKVVSREVHVRTEVRREVQVRTDVHHYVDEGLSVQDLVKKIGDMQWEFKSRITTVEQYVSQHKTSSTANDPMIMVLAILGTLIMMFTENPNDRAALINKITDMRVDFQRRITAIEQYLKISTSSNVEKTSVESHVDNQNVDNPSMDFDHDPKALEEPNMTVNNFFQKEDQQFSLKNFRCSTRGRRGPRVPEMTTHNNFSALRKLATTPTRCN